MKNIIPMMNGACIVLFILICLAFTTQTGRSIVLNEPVVPTSVVILTESGISAEPTLQTQAVPYLKKGYVIKCVSISIATCSSMGCTRKTGYMVLEKY